MLALITFTVLYICLRTGYQFCQDEGWSVSTFAEGFVIPIVLGAMIIFIVICIILVVAYELPFEIKERISAAKVKRQKIKLHNAQP